MIEAGILEFVDIGTGQWILHTTDGELRLFGDIPENHRGKKVVVEGEEFKGMSLGMMPGPAMLVHTVKMV